ncbi:MAG: membrane integrity-associated transporter subunit PqiC [gamma proteobacterium endosymbiont of Lamellibrachia anaximandri]|nr:membrane integrity-associated transporter subunit PqiC [gamma proteobacterium endosymbiont of Lamellibrachia anaximandri]
MKPLWKYPVALLTIASMLHLAGCASPSQPTRFYRLNAAVDLPATAETAQARLPEVGLGPVHLSSYLDRPQIVNRTGLYRLQLNEFDQWAGTLQENIIQVLVDYLSGSLGENRVVAYPWHSSLKPNYEISLYFSRFDALDGLQVILQARWMLLDRAGGKVLDTRQITISEPTQGTQPEAIVAAGSRALEKLSRQLEALLRKQL